MTSSAPGGDRTSPDPTAAEGPDAGTYVPGVCNIGPAEIARRRLAGHVGVLAAVVLLAVLVGARTPRSARLLLALPTAGAASGYLQAHRHFCAGFGARGVLNFGPVGHVTAVADPADRAADRAASRRLGRQSALIGLAVGALAVAAPPWH